MAANRIEQLIDEIYEFVEGCKPNTFAPNKVTLNKDELYDLLDELRERTPDEIKRYQKIIANRDAIIADANDKAEKIIEEAKNKARQLVGEHEIMQQAYARVNEMVAAAGQDADEMVAKAKAEADQLTSGALNYANNIMYDMEEILLKAYESTKERSEMLINTLKESYDAVAANRMEIYSQIDPNFLTNEYGDSVDEQPDDVNDEIEEHDDEEDYDFNEDTFLNNIEE
ncbi:MAG: ATPase [Lachnospiraceae bacterium]|nr:ATPase [Lachnospiraceae bacterium]